MGKLYALLLLVWKRHTTSFSQKVTSCALLQPCLSSVISSPSLNENRWNQVKTVGRQEIHWSHISWQDWVRARRAKMKQQLSTYVMLFHHEGICHDTPGLIPYKQTGIPDLWCYFREELSSVTALPRLKKDWERSVIQFSHWENEKWKTEFSFQKLYFLLVR